MKTSSVRRSDWAILASGPSACAEDAEKVRGRAGLIVVNCAWVLAPWADVLYACDAKWWRRGGDRYGQEARRRFAGRKLCQDRAFCSDAADVGYVRVERTHQLQPAPALGSGNNSGFQALNLALHLGARRVMLLGYDMHGERGLHFHPQHPAGMKSPDIYTFRRWRSPFDAAVPVLERLGVEVVNCTPGSRLTCFPQMGIEEALG